MTRGETARETPGAATPARADASGPATPVTRANTAGTSQERFIGSAIMPVPRLGGKHLPAPTARDRASVEWTDDLLDRPDQPAPPDQLHGGVHVRTELPVGDERGDDVPDGSACRLGPAARLERCPE